VWSTTDAERLLALDAETFCAELAGALQHALGEVSAPTRRVAFPLRLAHAATYVQARFALVGDSAHSVHPLAGQGVNLGLADARALAAELAAARDAGRDWAGLRVLKRYERARRADNLDMLAVTDALYRAFGLDLPGAARLLQAGMSAVDRLALAKRPLLERALG
jgi:2-polyprenyl-6-methoxyphenol hydroxylase-like FAD-dependent oxidoreductase